MDANSTNGASIPSNLTASDTESVSSGKTSGVQECKGMSRARTRPRGISVTARFWQETNIRLRCLQAPGSTLSTNTGSRATTPPKLIPSKKPLSLSDSPISSPQTISTTNNRMLSHRWVAPSFVLGRNRVAGVEASNRENKKRGSKRRRRDAIDED
uniref:Uncharacterized protein n=1 Tax=Nelumbo nucifera TaxID=4432 RepID=A0A822YJG2_NELNU|nr:TPA_asm: hypothetical protein HUJ06_011508 [Nelumbo nucifera]